MSGTPADAAAANALFGDMAAAEAFSAADVFGGDALFSTAAGYGDAAAGVAGAAGAAGAGGGENYDFGGFGATPADLAGTGATGMDFAASGMTAADFGAFGSTPAEMLGPNGATGLFSNLAWSDVKPWIGPAMSVGSGLFGMRSADQMRRMAALAGSRSDPWGQSGGRALADSQLQELMRNPGGVAENDPAYKLRIQGAQRAMGPMGQGSGAMAVAGANASTDWFNQRLAQLGGMAGASASPAAGAYTQMTGDIAANDLASKSLASIGYGVTRATGGGTALPPAVQEWFRQMGFANG